MCKAGDSTEVKMSESEQTSLLQGLLLCFAVAIMPDMIIASFFPDFA